MKGEFVLFRSSFARVLAGFLLVIVIVGSANVISLEIYVRTMEREITRNAGERIENLIAGFESQISEVQTELIRLYRSELFTPVVENPNPSSFSVALLAAEMRQFILLKNVFVKDFFMLLTDSDYVFSAYGVYNASVFFGTVYYSDIYNYGFWKASFNDALSFRSFPANVFIDGTVEGNRSTLLMPISFKTAGRSRFILVAYLDIDKLFGWLEPTFSDGLVIANGDAVIYPADAVVDPTALRAHAGMNFARSGSGYELVRVSEGTGFLYYKQIPATVIVRQLRRSRFTFALILLLSLAVSVASSVYIANRFNNPVKAIVAMLRRTGASASIRGVTDMRFIAESTERMALGNLIKNPGDAWKGVRERLSIGAVYRLVLFIIHRRPLDQETPGIVEAIDSEIRKSADDSVTIELQHDQVISIVNSPTDETHTVKNLRMMLDRFAETIRDTFFTVVLTRSYREITDLHAAYLGAVEAARYRKAIDRSQLLEAELMDREKGRFYFTATQSSRFSSLLAAERDEECRELADKIIEYNVRQGVTSFYLGLLCTELINSCIQVLTSRLLEIPPELNVANTHARLETCTTMSDFRHLMDDFIAKVIEFVRSQEKPSDHIVDSIHEYVEKHYDEELYLDLLAGKLSITKNYLSAYFKGKTGTNLTDYISGYRIDRAKELMASTDWKIKDIGDKVGIRDTNTFIRTFRKHTGWSPREYRRQHLSSDSQS